MALRYYANAPATTLATSCTDTSLTIEVSSVTGFPISFPYTLILDRGESTEEVVEVINASGTTLTVTRGVDSTTSFAHEPGASVLHGFSARDLREPNLHINSENDVHGVTGSVVGTSDVQTLTNKSLSLGSNTLSGVSADHFLTGDSSGNVVSDVPLPAGDVVGTTGVQVLQNKVFDGTSPSVFFPPGLLSMFGGTSAPSGWLICDGTAVSRSTYADLFAAIGTSYGAGNGSTTFNLPDLRNSFARGGNTQLDVGNEGGSATHTLTTGQLPSHTHGAGSLSTSTNGGHQHELRRSNNTGSGSELARGSNSIDVTNNIPIDSQGSHTHNITGSTGSTGSGNSFSILPPYVTVNFIIKY